MILEKFVVLAGAAGDVENRARARCGDCDHGAQNLALMLVVLEVVDGVVKLGTFEEHRASIAIRRGGFTGARCGKNLVGMKARETVRLDLRGVKCPLNWARAKVRLEQMARGEVLDLTLDDPRGARDIPGAAEAEGYVVLEATARDGVFHLRIER